MRSIDKEKTKRMIIKNDINLQKHKIALCTQNKHEIHVGINGIRKVLTNCKIS